MNQTAFSRIHSATMQAPVSDHKEQQTIKLWEEKLKKKDIEIRILKNENHKYKTAINLINQREQQHLKCKYIEDIDKSLGQKMELISKLENKVDILERELNLRDAKMEDLEALLLKMKELPAKLHETQ